MDTWDKLPESRKKCKCGGELCRTGNGPSTSVYETLDNGAMVKAVERLADVERLMKERNDAADPIAGTKKNYS